MNKTFLTIILVVLGLAFVGGCVFAGNRFFMTKAVKGTNDVAAQSVDSPIADISPTSVATPSISSSTSPKPTVSVSASPKPSPTSTPVQAAVASGPSFSPAFQWGVTMRPNVLGKYSGKTWQQQIDQANNLGVGWARINWDYDNSDPAGRNSQIIGALKSNGLKTLLVIEHNPNKGNSNLYQQGLDDAKLITGAVGGNVDYYQLANEGGAQSLISGKSGVSPSDFDNTKYTQVRDYIKGLSDGISKGDSSAKKIVTISWIHTGFLDRLVADGVNFDMIGIDWYSWMGSFSAKKINGTDTVYHKLQTFGKPLTFMEVSTMPTAGSDDKHKTNVDEAAQASFLTNTANWAWANRNWVKGFYHFELVDNTFSAGYVDYYGLIKANNSGSSATLGGVRQAFNAYKDLIKGK